MKNKHEEKTDDPDDRVQRRQKKARPESSTGRANAADSQSLPVRRGVATGRPWRKLDGKGAVRVAASSGAAGVYRQFNGRNLVSICLAVSGLILCTIAVVIWISCDSEHVPDDWDI